MQYFVVINEFEEDWLTKRENYREEHFRLMGEAANRGELYLAGHLADPIKGEFGDGLLVFSVSDQSVVEAFQREDPYVRYGLVKRWTIKSWNAVVRPPKSERSVVEA